MVFCVLNGAQLLKNKRFGRLLSLAGRIQLLFGFFVTAFDPLVCIVHHVSSSNYLLIISLCSHFPSPIIDFIQSPSCAKRAGAGEDVPWIMTLTSTNVKSPEVREGRVDHNFELRRVLLLRYLKVS
jgi:hypothetical protein